MEKMSKKKLMTILNSAFNKSQSEEAETVIRAFKESFYDFECSTTFDIGDVIALIVQDAIEKSSSK